MTLEEGFEFSEYIHDLKDSGHGGTGKNGDFTFQELDDLAIDFLASPRKTRSDD